MRERSQAKNLSARFLEGEDDEEELEQSLLKIKKKYKQELARGISNLLYNLLFFITYCQ